MILEPVHMRSGRARLRPPCSVVSVPDGRVWKENLCWHCWAGLRSSMSRGMPNMTQASESGASVLLERARAGDRDILGRLLDGYRPYLMLLARMQIGRRLQGKVDAS